jgi:two-component system sensor kinase FixL
MVGLVLLALLPVALIGGYIVMDHARQARRHFQERLAERSDSVALALDREIEVISVALAVMASSPALHGEPDDARLVARAATVAAALGNTLVVHLPSEADRPGTPAALRRVFADGRPGIGQPSQPGTSAVPGLPIYQPVIENDHVVAVLEMGLSRLQVANLLIAQNRGTDSIGMVIDPGGMVVASVGEPDETAGLAPGWLTAPGGDQTVREGRLATGDTVVCMRVSPRRASGWLTATCQQRSEYEENWIAPLRERGLTLAASLVLGLGGATLLSRRLARPLRLLTEQARLVAAGHERTGEEPPTQVAEFEALSLAVREAEDALRQRAQAEHRAMLDAQNSQRLLASVLDAAADGIQVKDRDFRYVMANQASRAMLAGTPAADPVGKRAAELMDPAMASTVDGMDADVMQSGMARTVEVIRDVVGRMRRFALIKTPWRDAEGGIAGVVTVARDVTEARMAEERLRALQADLLRATRLSSMGAMASGLAHEISQPLAAASNFLAAAQRMLQRVAAGEDTALAPAREAVADATAQTLRAGAIVRRLREFVVRGEVALREEPVADLVTEAADLARADGTDAGVPIVTEIEPEIGTALVDRTQMQQVLLNLVRNAAEAIVASGGPRSGDRVTISAGRDGHGAILLSVIDTGPGLDPAVAGELFEPFTSTKSGGLGIGLAICRTIVEGHGGRLESRPWPGGARFDITLPPPLHVLDRLPGSRAA